jgi:hypothetical protein
VQRGGIVGKCVVARNINGIALNGFDYLLEDNGEIKVFNDIAEAMSFLKHVGATDEDINYYRFFDYEGLVNGNYKEIPFLLKTSEIFNRYKKYVTENIRIIDGSASITMEAEEEKNRPWSSSRHIRIDLECEEDESLNYELRISNHQDSGWRLTAIISSPLGLGNFKDCLPDQEIEIDLYSIRIEITR